MDCAPLQLIGLGAQTPVGRNVWSSTAAARAGLCGFSEHPVLTDAAGEPVRIARAPWLHHGVGGVQRCADLLLPAIHEAMLAVMSAGAVLPMRLGLALALPPQRPGRAPDLAGELLARVATRYPGVFHGPLTFEAGHAAGYQAMDAAFKSCAAGSVDAVVVGAVDSYVSRETLEWVEACDQLHGGGPLNNAWGFVPGEAAGAMLIGPVAFSQRIGAVPVCELMCVGIGHESRRIKTDEVCIGDGLTQAFLSALRTLAPGERVDNVICDMNGEPYRADEYAFTALRTKEHFRAVNDFIAPADCWGDVGAASAPLHVAMAAVSHLKHYGKGPLSMACASSESGERGAVVIRGIAMSES